MNIFQTPELWENIVATDKLRASYPKTTIASFAQPSAQNLFMESHLLKLGPTPIHPCCQISTLKYHQFTTNKHLHYTPPRPIVTIKPDLPNIPPVEVPKAHLTLSSVRRCSAARSSAASGNGLEVDFSCWALKGPKPVESCHLNSCFGAYPSYHCIM